MFVYIKFKFWIAVADNLAYMWEWTRHNIDTTTQGAGMHHMSWHLSDLLGHSSSYTREHDCTWNDIHSQQNIYEYMWTTELMSQVIYLLNKSNISEKWLKRRYMWLSLEQSNPDTQAGPFNSWQGNWKEFCFFYKC
jgi:hypothetical protein